MANSVDPDQTAPIGAVCPGSTLFASILNLSVMFCNYLQQKKTFSDAFFLGALRVKSTIVINSSCPLKRQSRLNQTTHFVTSFLMVGSRQQIL